MDRVQQINFLRELAETFANNGNNDVEPGVTAAMLVDFWLPVLKEEEGLPDWFDKHDRQLLVEYVGEAIS